MACIQGVLMSAHFLKTSSRLCLAVCLAAGIAAAPARAADPAPAARPWADASLSADARADAVLKAMTQDEKLTLVFGYFSTDGAWLTKGTKRYEFPKEGLPDSAGYVPGIARLGIPAQWQTDAGVGVATQRSPKPRLRTALPSGIATAATWNKDVAFAGGAMIGREAFLSGFNVQLAGGMNLLREPRNGRNFEYGGEDPLLSGVITGNEIKGIQSNHIISTMKHYAFNGQETNRFTMDHKIGDQAARQSDLLAFQIADEIGDPGSVMCSYNRVNGFYACENDWLLNQVLKTDWGFKGYVMSDWGATHSTIPAALNGLDQQSGWSFDRSNYFEGALRDAVNNGHVPQSRVDDMARRILYAMFDNGLIDHPVNGDQSKSIDYAAHGKITQTDAEEGIVLLKNTGVLPLVKTAKSILLVGGHADFGVLSGGGSSQVYAEGAKRFDGEGPEGFPGPLTYYASSPLKALQARTGAKVTYVDGKDARAAAKAAKTADVVIVFGTQWTGESLDVPDLNLPDKQDALISAVAGANKKTVVVLETGGPVVMPWLSRVSAVLVAWYPGSSGGEAIARVLAGEVNPSGRLPATFPASLAQTPRPVLEGDPKLDDNAHPHSDYDIEGAAMGYKWFDKKGLKPLFAFGHGLSYTTFIYDGLKAGLNGADLNVTLTLKNTGAVDGKNVIQVYVAPPKGASGWEAPKRLGAFDKVALKAGESAEVSLKVDPRLLAVYDSTSKTWKRAAGDYQVILARSATDIVATTTVALPERTLDVKGK
jgi:beta-glucosidase